MIAPGKRALALLLALSGGLSFYWLASSGKPCEVDITGIVRDAHGPVSGASVRIKGTAVAALTNSEGAFRLPRAESGRATAWKAGYLIAGTPLGKSLLDLQLVPVSKDDQENYAWVDPSPDLNQSGNCANCHAAIYREWSASGHSRSASGKHFRNLYEGTDWNGTANVSWGLLIDNPDGTGVCASCHAPAIPGNDTAALLDLRQLSGVATRGVHCDYCHKIAEVGNGTFGLTHGRFNLRQRRPTDAKQLFFGPLDDVDRGEDAYSPLYHDSRYCASCHEGIVFGVPVYTTYSEWLESPARRQGKQCQDCHMTPTGALTNFAPGHGGIERDPKTLANHRFFAPDREEMLCRSVRVETTAQRTANGVRAIVRLRAENVGHRVPTGFIDRHLILVVEGFDADGKRVGARTGPQLPTAAGAELSGRPGRLFAKLLTGSDGKAPAPFWRAGGALQDNRLQPGRVEEIVWTFPSEISRLRVRVLYRRFWVEVAQSKGWSDRDTVVHEESFLPQ